MIQYNSNMDQQYYEIPSNFAPVFNVAKALIKERGEIDAYEIITNAKLSVQNTDYDGWNGGTYGYTVYVGLSVKQYTSFSPEKITKIEKIVADSLNEAIKGSNNDYFIVQIEPTIGKDDIDWDAVGGRKGRALLRQNIETIRDIMISVATGRQQIQVENTRYTTLYAQIQHDCKVLNLTFNNPFPNLWAWYGKWKADFRTYQERRAYINDLFAPMLVYFDENMNFNNVSKVETLVELDEWDRITRTLTKIKRDSNNAKNEEDFQTVGLLCREVIISLAQAVYNPKLHGSTDEKGVVIGNSDANRMIGNYVNIKLSGGSNEELRAYARNTNKLANRLTHERNATKKDMLLSVASTIALINFIGIIEEKF